LDSIRTRCGSSQRSPRLLVGFRGEASGWGREGRGRQEGKLGKGHPIFANRSSPLAQLIKYIGRPYRTT